MYPWFSNFMDSYWENDLELILLSLCQVETNEFFTSHSKMDNRNSSRVYDFETSILELCWIENNVKYDNLYILYILPC